MRVSEELKNIYQENGRLQYYFDDVVPCHLYRGQTQSNADKKAPIIFPHPGFSRKNGPNRPPDVKIVERGGKEFVLGCRCVKGLFRGVSTFDGINPVLKNFVWYKLPNGTKIPAALAITQDSDWSGRINHFTIAPKDDMPLDLFLVLLNSLTKYLQKV